MDPAAHWSLEPNLLCSHSEISPVVRILGGILGSRGRGTRLTCYRADEKYDENDGYADEDGDDVIKGKKS